MTESRREALKKVKADLDTRIRITSIVGGGCYVPLPHAIYISNTIGDLLENGGKLE